MIPARYHFLTQEPGPKHLLTALSLYGTTEVAGPENNPEIMKWAEEVGVENYTGDIIPWCGLFAAVVLVRSGWRDHVPHTPLWAKSWSKTGNPVPINEASLGDILVFQRPGGGGHVNFYVGEDEHAFHGIGGNQSDTVNVTRIVKSRCLAVRRLKWRHAQPPNVRPIRLLAKGTLSKNEA
jgi:uncharacterized protein (TIGR02594 family)